MDRVIFGYRLVYPEWDRPFTVGAGQLARFCRCETNLTIAGSALHEYNCRHETPNFDPFRGDFSRSTNPRRCRAPGARTPGAVQEYPRFLRCECAFVELEYSLEFTDCASGCGSVSGQDARASRPWRSCVKRSLFGGGQDAVAVSPCCSSVKCRRSACRSCSGRDAEAAHPSAGIGRSGDVAEIADCGCHQSGLRATYRSDLAQRGFDKAW
jgi:hypothetical protein